MVLNPFSLLCLLRVVSFLDIVSEFVISYNESIELLCVLYAIRIIIVLRRSFDYEAFVGHCMQKFEVVWDLSSFSFFDASCC